MNSENSLAKPKGFYNEKESYLISLAKEFEHQKIIINIADKEKIDLILHFWQLLLITDNSQVRQELYNLFSEPLLISREKTLLQIVINNSEFLKKEFGVSKMIRYILEMTVKFFMEQGNIEYAIKIFMSIRKVTLLFLIFPIKALVSALAGVFFVISAEELMNFSTVLSQQTNNLVPFVLLILTFIYFGFKDYTNVRPSLKWYQKLYRGIYPFAIIFSVSSFIFSLPVSVFCETCKVEWFANATMATFIATFTQVFWDKDSSTKPL